jgi:chemotaxis receptor (MCP) glutamine deamidase CheD
MESSVRDVTVPPDRFEVMTDDVVFRAELRSAIAVCIYDAVDEAGAMLHLRFIIRGTQPAEVTDTTLAAELLLLDRCVEALREAAPAARALQARIAAHLPEGARTDSCEKLLELLVQYLSDAGATVRPADIGFGTARNLQFRPSMGWVQLR